jgi:3D (Asp-Asp-Asp) domain-containing protein
MIIARSFWRKSIATAVAAGGFIWLYEATILDSRYAMLTTVLHESSALPSPGLRLAFAATAYCKGMTTSAGVAVQSGIAAADPELLPVGSVIQIDSLADRYDGIYTVMDTGPSVQGRQVDIYMWSCNEALRFGRRSIQLTVLRLGWNPRATTPSFVDRFFNHPADTPPPLPSRPLPQLPSDSELEK